MATYSFVTQAQLERIRTKVQEQTLDSNLEERKRLKELSDARAASWPNTLQAARARKERARQERHAAEESERVQIDRREAELRAEQRRVQIERANKILFDSTDKVKAFHSQMLLSDVLKENEVQVEHRKQVEVLKRAQEQAFVEQQRQAMEAAEISELKKFEETKRRALDQKAIQMQQLEELKAKILAERAMDRQEGQVLKQRAQEEAEEMRAKDLARLEKARVLNMETARANDVLQAFKLEEMRRQKEQEAAVEAYSKKKAEMVAEREKREQEKRARKDAERKKIADMMEKSYVNFAQAEAERVDRDVAIAEEKSAADEAARRRRRQEQIAAIDASRQQQLSLKAQAKAKEKADEQDFSKAWQQRVTELKEEEQAEFRERFDKARQLQAFQLRQAHLKARKLTAAKIQEMQDAAMIQLTLAEQEEIFRQYAEVCIAEYRRQGKSTVPMELHLAKKETIESLR